MQRNINELSDLLANPPFDGITVREDGDGVEARIEATLSHKAVLWLAPIALTTSVLRTELARSEGRSQTALLRTIDAFTGKRA